MTFELDRQKSESNRRKHGIDFPAAAATWEDSDRVEIPARTEGEPRFMVIGGIEGRVWSAVITYRGENVRVISVRAARREEVAIYEDEGI